MTSVLSRVEVAFLGTEGETHNLDPKVTDKLDDIWERDPCVEVLEFHDGTALEARRLMREAIDKGTKRLNPRDAIHLASAKLVGVDEFNTFDRHFDGATSQVPFSIRPPQAKQPKIPGLDN